MPPRDAASGASHLSATIVSALVHGYVSTTLFRFVIFVFRPIVACQFSLLCAIPRSSPVIVTALVFLASRFSVRADVARRSTWCSSLFNWIARVYTRLPFSGPLELGWHACLTERLTSATELLVKATARLPTCRCGLLRNREKERRPARRSVSRETEKKRERTTEENSAIRPIDQERGSLLSVRDVPRFFDTEIDFLYARCISVERFSGTRVPACGDGIPITLCEETSFDSV